MAIWDSVSDNYVEAAVSAFPLHRLAVFAAAFVFSLVAKHPTHGSIFESVVASPIAEMVSLSHGLLEGATLGDAFLGIAIVFAGWAYSRGVLWLVFFMAARLTDFRNRVNQSLLHSPINTHLTLEDRQTALALVDSSLLEVKKRLRSMYAMAELFGGVGIASLVMTRWGGRVDALVGVLLCAIAIGYQVMSVRRFFSDYLGPALYRAQIQGRQAPVPSDTL